MSAFMVSNKHINSMLGYLFTRGKTEITYYDGVNSGRTLSKKDAVKMLHDENVRSLTSRYGSAAAGVYGKPAVMTVPLLAPVQVLKLLDCYDYQACESDDYYTTDAAMLVRVCRKAAIMAMPGYNEAEWAIGESMSA